VKRMRDLGWHFRASVGSCPYGPHNPMANEIRVIEVGGSHLRFCPKCFKKFKAFVAQLEEECGDE